MSSIILFFVGWGVVLPEVSSLRSPLVEFGFTLEREMEVMYFGGRLVLWCFCSVSWCISPRQCLKGALWGSGTGQAC